MASVVLRAAVTRAQRTVTTTAFFDAHLT